MHTDRRETRVFLSSDEIRGLRSVSYWALIVITIFSAVTAAGGGIGLLITGGLGMPIAILADGPFPTFVWPGLILLIVVGGSQALAAVLLLRRRETALIAAAVAGFGMQIWVFGELLVIGEGSALQLAYFGTGTLQLIFVFALAGIAGWLPRAPLRPAGRRWRPGTPNPSPAAPSSSRS
ncbi:hypothetical protein [Microlunatus sp. GCM10028923]|uniref:hypothetical protein n=1 Tax=Microlunatus sp. GCM10028923 TaxID=3273400 RepID=UPI00361A5B27